MILDMFDFNFKFEIKSMGFWKMKEQLAENWVNKRVILCGDSAHVFPPAGGFGMNSGIDDAYQLSHKLLLI